MTRAAVLLLLLPAALTVTVKPTVDLLRIVDPRIGLDRSFLNPRRHLKSAEARAAARKVEAELATMAYLAEKCDTGDEVACDVLSKEAEAKTAWMAKIEMTWGVAAKGAPAAAAAAPVISWEAEEAKDSWLAKIDAPTWGVTSEVAPATSATAALMMSSEEEAKQAWLAKLDVPAWGGAKEETTMIYLTEKCFEGDEVACDALSQEEDAKKAWLAKVDMTWGSSTIVAAGPKMSEEDAKRAWLAKVDQERMWGAAIADLTEKCDSGDEVACDALSVEEEAKKVWLAKVDATWGGAAAAAATAPKMSEEEAKRAWLAKVDQERTWGAVIADLTEQCDSGIDVACDALTVEEAAKASWLAKIEAPSWGPTAGSSEAAAKVRWLASADMEPAWTRDGAARATPAAAPIVHALSAEEAAKMAWLAKADALNGVVTPVAPVAPVAALTAAPVLDTLVTAEAVAKRAWLAAVEAARA